ncbi:MAG: hypothetical protein ISS36_01615 [Candidatus Aenigmarchaeota archaeon]|nr:hypothetical protein [Candidatus Aenigmarchaeota archaeon]
MKGIKIVVSKADDDGIYATDEHVYCLDHFNDQVPDGFKMTQHPSRSPETWCKVCNVRRDPNPWGDDYAQKTVENAFAEIEETAMHKIPKSGSYYVDGKLIVERQKSTARGGGSVMAGVPGGV